MKFPTNQFVITPVAPEVQPGEIVQFTAIGDSTLTWTVTETGGGTIAADGQYTAPQTEGTYTITAANTVYKASTVVHVSRKPTVPVISSLTASPSTVTKGASTTLSWTVVGATSIQIDNGVGAVTGNSKSVTPAATTTYSLTATNAAGSATATATVTVSAVVDPPPVSSQGAGTTYKATYLTGVTGGGTMPSWTSNVVTASCAGDGVTDDTTCLQTAANSARTANKPLVIPTKSSFYKITGPITVYTSVGGVGGMPTIKQTNLSSAWGVQRTLILGSGMSGWIYNLHLIGTFNGSNAVTEFGHQIDLGTVNGVTIKNNLLENAMGDAVCNDAAQNDGGTAAQNVIVDANTIRNPYRNGVAFVYSASNWVITNNLIDKQVNFVSGIDIEPEKGGIVLHVEIAYNKYVMNNRTVNPSRGADGMAVFGWHVDSPPSASAGGDYYVHHNYGTFGAGFSGFGNGGWGYIYQASNAEGQTVPTP